jgi:uncharacterized membrane protein
MTESASATGTAALRAPEPSLVSYTHWMYALHALSAAISLFGSAAIITAFVFGMPSIVAVVMITSVTATRGTLLESHFVAVAFWMALLWAVGLCLFCAVLAATLILLPLAAISFLRDVRRRPLGDLPDWPRLVNRGGLQLSDAVTQVQSRKASP